MKASELIKSIEQIIKDHGDIPVRINADHGQELMSATYVGVVYVESHDEYMPEYSEEDDFDNGLKAIEIQGY